MKQFCVAILTCAAIAAPKLSAAQALANLGDEKDRVRGTFSMVSGTADGEAMPAMMAKGMKRVAEGNVTTVTMSGMLYMKADFSIDPMKSPKTIDYDMTGGFTAGKKQLGIYRWNGDTVTFCFASPGSARPAEFVSRAGSGVTCTDWKRDQK
jgi:uncharacterized protein (TIGR03067 family)